MPTQKAYLNTLIERRDYLTARIEAKVSVGWETVYDTRERNALTWAIDALIERLITCS